MAKSKRPSKPSDYEARARILKRDLFSPKYRSRTVEMKTKKAVDEKKEIAEWLHEDP